MSNGKIISRDISWLSFNHRVLQEAQDPKVPIFERIKFLAIYSSNLDEFYRVRVAVLREFKKLNKNDRKDWLRIKPKKELKKIRAIVHQQQTEFGMIFRHQVLPALKKEGIVLYNHPDEYNSQQKAFAKNIFTQQLRADLVPQLTPPNEKAPFLKNKGLYLLVTFTDTDHLGLINIPSDIHQRFWNLPASQGHIAIGFLDDIVRIGLSDCFASYTIDNAYALKISRDAELYIGDEFHGDLVEKIRKSLKKRDTGVATRMLYDPKMPMPIKAQLKDIFELKKNDLFPGGRYHNFHDFFQLANPTSNPHLENPPLPPLEHPAFKHTKALLDAIAIKDHILHFPYQQYDYIPRLIEEAACDSNVRYLKITLYRVAGKSKVVEALLKAKRNGKDIIVFIEAKARFDEASNLHWGQELEKAGAKVYYSYPNIKVHTKLLLIGRKENHSIRHYAYLGTGNFNEKTARIYGDHALLTSQSALADEVEAVFRILEKKLTKPDTKHLLVAPFSARTGFEQRIDQEIAHAKAGGEAYMILKMNSLEDTRMIEKLYEASNAGVKIKMIIRGICRLVPGIPGLSENIIITSIIDRFLEHARVYIFGNRGQEVMYISSADWMERNLDRRIEVVVPIYDADVFQELRHIINLQLQDNTKARQIDTTQSNPYLEQSNHILSLRSQVAIYRYLKTKSELT